MSFFTTTTNKQKELNHLLTNRAANQPMENKQTNPFTVTGNMEPQYPCARADESARVIRAIQKRNDMVLISPRRMGRRGFVESCYQKPEIKEHHHTFFVDILHTSNVRELAYVLAREVLQKLPPKGEKMKAQWVQILESTSGTWRVDPQTNLPVFDLEWSDFHNPEHTLPEIFRYLSSADKRCVVAIDEFQQIEKYQEKKIRTLLRSCIQQTTNSNFIFAGSQRGLMQRMFLSSARPLYRTADILELEPIPRQIYVHYIVEQFAGHGRWIEPDNAAHIYDLFVGHTSYIQKVFSEAFTETAPGEECTQELLRRVVDEQIADNDIHFRELLSRLPERQKQLLYAIASEGEAQRILSFDFITRHKLNSASSVQSAIKKLVDKDLASEFDRIYSITNKLFGLWINRLYNRRTLS